MTNNRFPYAYPLSEADLAEIRHRASVERAKAVSVLFTGIKATLGRFLKAPGSGAA